MFTRICKILVMSGGKGEGGGGGGKTGGSHSACSFPLSRSYKEERVIGNWKTGQQLLCVCFLYFTGKQQRIERKIVEEINISQPKTKS